MKDRFRLFWKKILRLQDSPENIARGFAIGVFLGVAPSFGLATPLGLALAWLVGANRVAAVLGSIAGFPPLVPFIYLGGAFIGTRLLGGSMTRIYELAQAGRYRDAFRLGGAALAVGTVVLATAAAAVAYGLAKVLAARHQARRKARATLPAA